MLFAGYDPFKALRKAELVGSLLPRPVHQAVRMTVGLLPTSHGYMSFGFKVKRALRGTSYPKMLWNPIWLGPLEPTELTDLFNEPTALEDVYSAAIGYWEDCRADNLVDRTLRFYTKLYLQDGILVKLDRASMMHSLEARSPFLDVELADFVREQQFERLGVFTYSLEPDTPAARLDGHVADALMDQRRERLGVERRRPGKGPEAVARERFDLRLDRGCGCRSAGGRLC